jgi:hypothetical protein
MRILYIEKIFRYRVTWETRRRWEDSVKTGGKEIEYEEGG